MRALLLVVVLLLGGTALTGCAADPAVRTDCAPIGTRWDCGPWRATALGVRTPVGTLTDADLTLTFTGSAAAPQLVIGTPCNTLSGDLRTADRRSVALGPVTSTAMLCTGAAGEPEIAARAFFARPAAVTVDGGTVRLSNAGGFLELAPPAG